MKPKIYVIKDAFLFGQQPGPWLEAKQNKTKNYICIRALIC